MEIFLIIVVLILAFTIGVLLRRPRENKAKLTVKDLSARARGQVTTLVKAVMDLKKNAVQSQDQGLVYVINFKGDLMASQVECLREEVNAILTSKEFTKPKEVIVRLKSPGGTVPGYGLAAAQLARIRKAGIPLTVTIDEVAASGGYMMAAVANKIVAAPFAIVGSIGVVMEFPNFSRLLHRLGVEYKQYTAGESKRTLSPFRPTSLDGEEKTREKLANMHELFKKHIQKYRAGLNIDQVATGETWYGEEAQSLKLIDDIRTSDEYLHHYLFTHRVIELIYVKPEKLTKKFSLGLVNIINGVGEYWLSRFHRDTL